MFPTIVTIRTYFSLFSIKYLILSLETPCVLCEGETDFLYWRKKNFSLHWSFHRPVVFLRSVTAEGIFHPRSVYVRFVVDKLSLADVFLQVVLSSPVSNIPQVPHTHLDLHVAFTRRASGRRLGTFQKAVHFRKSEIIGYKSTVTFSLYIWLTANFTNPNLPQLRVTGGLPSHWQRHWPVPQLSWLSADWHDTTRVAACSGLLARAHAAWSWLIHQHLLGQHLTWWG